MHIYEAAYVSRTQRNTLLNDDSQLSQMKKSGSLVMLTSTTPLTVLYCLPFSGQGLTP